MSEGDRIDLRPLLAAFNPATDDISKFVHVSSSVSDSTISVDTAGTSHFTDVAVLHGTTGLDLNQLKAQSQLITS